MKFAKVLFLIFFITGCSKLSGHKKIDYDLSKLNETYIYAQFFNMLVEPEEYEGKTIKIKGMFRPYLDYDEDGNEIRYYGCIVPDATACCYQGIEFEGPEGMVYPDDFPEFEQDIIVTGTFHQWEDKNGYTRTWLINTTLEFEK